jgi:arylsulfatase A-like enzyme
MNKKGIFILMLIVLFLPCVVEAAQPEKPNVIIFLADDLGWADVGFRGSPIKTPAIDRLARQGVRLERLYTTPICTPTRVGLMTGRDPLPQGLAYTQISPWQNLGVPLDEHFMSESFKAAGYQTGMIGKWHLGHSIRQYLPNARGFDYF